MNIVGILGSLKDFPAFVSEYESLYKTFNKLGKKHNVEFVRVKTDDYILDKKKFKGVRQLDKDNYVRKEGLQPEVILTKINTVFFSIFKISESFMIINPPSFIELTNDKNSTAFFFQERSPKTIGLKKIISKPIRFDEISNDLVVLKPNRGSFGIDVSKTSKQEILDNIKLNKYKIPSRMIVQELIEMNKGIPGLIEGIHDIRVICFGDKMPLAIVRSPSKGEFRCNLAQEGQQKIVKFEELPEYMQKVAKDISNRIFELIGTKNLYYSIDLCQDDNGRIILIELNSNIGLKRLENKPEYTEIYVKHLSELALSAIEEKTN